MPPSHKSKPTAAGHRRAGARAAPVEKKAAARSGHARVRVAAKAHPALKSAPAAKAAATKVVAAPKAVAGKLPVPVKGVAAPKAGAPAGKGSPKLGAAARNAVVTSAIERRAIAPEDRQSQLKLLIARGKEQGYLTYAQVNDHLPSEIVDPEQIEDIVNTINDMGIPVYEKAPDSQSLLASDPASPADEEAIEEAAAALAALDAELGRTTDPVRMYMREMGTVELLTREGEIRIAKRIEEGLDAVRGALAMYPATYDFILRAYEPVKAGQSRLVDVIVGFIDPNAPDVIAQPQNPTKLELVEAEEKSDEEEESDDGSGDSEEEAVDTGPDPVEAATRFLSLSKGLIANLASIEKLGAKEPKTFKARKKLADEFMELKLSPRMFDALIMNLRTHVAEVRQLEKEIMIIAVRDAGMPRKDFISTFPKNETSNRWLQKHVKAGKKYSAPLAKFKDEIERRQKKLEV